MTTTITMIADNRKIHRLILTRGIVNTVNPTIDEIVPYYEKTVLWFAVIFAGEIKARINSGCVEEVIYDEKGE